MKTKNEITASLASLKMKLGELEEKYSSLHQIDMVGREGYLLKEKINNIEGQICALEWIIT
jgi:hypothetical protein